MAPLLGKGADLSDLDRVLITLVQTSFPLVRRPFQALGDALGTSEQVVLDRLAELKGARLIRKIGPVFEPARFGISSELMAVRVLPEHLSSVAGEASAWPPVTHCYARSHEVNLWMAALSADAGWFERAVGHLLGMPGVCGVWRLPAIRRFKVAVRFDLTDDTRSAQERLAELTASADDKLSAGADGSQPDPANVLLLAAMEADLPLCREPFSVLAEDHGLDAAGILSALRQWREDGRVRRYGALVSHLRLGFKGNAMAVWRVPADRVEDAGNALAASPQVSHCYERPAFADFPFNLYAMVHDTTIERSLSVVQELSRHCGDEPPAVLFSTAEFKKSSPRYAALLAVAAISAPDAEFGAGTGGMALKQSESRRQQG